MDEFMKKQIELAKQGCDTENIKIEFTKNGDLFVNGVKILECEDIEDFKHTNISVYLEIYADQIEFLKRIED